MDIDDYMKYKLVTGKNSGCLWFFLAVLAVPVVLLAANTML